MPKPKVTPIRISSREVKKKIAIEIKEINEPVCKEEDLIGIGVEAPVIDLTGKKKSSSSKSKIKTKPKKEEEKEKKKSPKKEKEKNESPKKKKEKNKSSEKKKRVKPKKEVTKDTPWSDLDNDRSSDSEGSEDWFEKFFEEKDKAKEMKKKKKLTKDAVEKKTEKKEVKKKVEEEKAKENKAEEKKEKVLPKKEPIIAPVSENANWSDDNLGFDGDSLDSDASNDSFDKYFPPQEEKGDEKTSPKPKRKIIRLEYSMVQHLEGYEVASRIYCSICKGHYNQMPGHPQNYTDHIINIHAKAVGDDMYLCTYCNNTTPKSLKNLKIHLFRHREMAKPKTCSVCGEIFTDYNKWRCHMRMEKSAIGNHPDKRVYPCDTCGKICATNKSLQMHVLIIHEKLGRKCRWCPRIVPYDEWEEHKEMEKAKNGVRTPTTCEICGTTFTSKDSAANHRRNFQ